MKIVNKAILLVIVLLSACSSAQIFSDYDRSADFSKYASFAWLRQADSVQNYWYNNQLVERNVINFANTELKNRGFSVDPQNPDLLLEYNISTQKQHYTVNNPIYSGSTNYIIGYNQQQIEYTEGTLLINVIDRVSNNLIWRGWSISNEQDLENQLQSDIHKIFKTYPIPLPKRK